MSKSRPTSLNERKSEIGNRAAAGGPKYYIQSFFVPGESFYRQFAAGPGFLELVLGPSPRVLDPRTGGLDPPPRFG